MRKRWFYVAADYKCVFVGQTRRRHNWERRVFVFQAPQAQSEDIALKIAKSNEHEYKNAWDETVRWTFMGIESIGELFDSTIKHGTEVYWDWFVKVDKPKSKPAKRRPKSGSR